MMDKVLKCYKCGIEIGLITNGNRIDYDNRSKLVANLCSVCMDKEYQKIRRGSRDANRV